PSLILWRGDFCTPANSQEGHFNGSIQLQSQAYVYSDTIAIAAMSSSKVHSTPPVLEYWGNSTPAMIRGCRIC
ncbi:hypothetical protein HNY73_011736, partial [Argiope bruennichi]